MLPCRRLKAADDTAIDEAGQVSGGVGIAKFEGMDFWRIERPARPPHSTMEYFYMKEG